MYHYIQDRDFQKRMKGHCAELVNQLVQSINRDSVMTVRADLVGSGAKNLVTQNGNEPVDLDYNLCIKHLKSLNLHDGREIKEYIRKKFNIVLQKNGWGDCQDSSSVLTTKKQLRRGVKTAFGIDLAVIYEDANSCSRLIHEKRGDVREDRYYWNAVPRSRDLKRKAAVLKSKGLWADVRNTYLDKKNFYLQKNDRHHPSFIVYLETINQIYDQYSD